MLLAGLFIVIGVGAFFICAFQIVAQNRIASRGFETLMWRDVEPSEHRARSASESATAAFPEKENDAPGETIPASERPALVALNSKTRKALGARAVPLHVTPFRVGRECRVRTVDGHTVTMERRKGGARPNNDLYMVNVGKALYISREHFLIRRTENNGYVLEDRGSRCGTGVGDRIIGGNDKTGECELKNGDIIRVGGDYSPFEFKFKCSDKALVA